MVVNTWPLVSVAGTAMTVVLPFGRTTLALTPCALLGPALVMLTVTVTVCPGVLLAGALSAIATSDTGLTTRTAVDALALVPRFVVKEPALMVLVTVPPSELVTTTETVQVDAGGINVALGSVTESELGAAVAAPAIQPVVTADDGNALTKPDG